MAPADTFGYTVTETSLTADDLKVTAECNAAHGFHGKAVVKGCSRKDHRSLPSVRFRSFFLFLSGDKADVFMQKGMSFHLTVDRLHAPVCNIQYYMCTQDTTHDLYMISSPWRSEATASRVARPSCAAPRRRPRATWSPSWISTATASMCASDAP